jgi:hypothetical protein
MRRIREVLRLSTIVGEYISAIARGGKLARSTVRDYLDRAKAAGIDAAKAAEMTDNALDAALIKHYGTVVLPARVRKPRDKPSAESSVLQVYRWLLAPLRYWGAGAT